MNKVFITTQNKLLSGVNTFFLGIFITLIFLMPTIRLYGSIPIRVELPLVCIFILILLIVLKVKFPQKKMGMISNKFIVFNFLYQSIVIFFCLFFYPFELKSILNPVIWLSYFFIAFFLNLISTGYNKQAIVSYIKILVSLELIIGILQKFNIFGIRSWEIFDYIAKNTASYFVDLDSDRVVGTFGNPVWFNIVMFGLCKVIHINTKKTIWLIMGFLFITLGFSRNVAMFAIVFEVISSFFPYKNFNAVLINFRNLLIKVVPIVIISCFIIFYSESTKLLILNLLFNTQNEYSFSYRLSTIEWVKQNLANPIFGDPWDSDLPNYLDMGYILSLKKFGFLGLSQYLLFFIPILCYKRFKSFRERQSYVFVCMYILILELTGTTVGNSLFVSHIIFWVFITSSLFEEKNNDLFIKSS